MLTNGPSEISHLLADPDLKQLKLSRYSNVTPQGILELGRQLNTNTSLKSLKIYHTRIDIQAATEISKGLSNNKTLEKLQLLQNYLGAGGCLELAAGIQKNNSLRKLTIQLNTIGPRGANAIGKIAAEKLTHLCLDFNEIGVEGLKEISRALAVNQQLKVLRLHNNTIGGLGAIELSKGLFENHSLTKLDLSVNRIDSEGAKAILKALEYHKSIACLLLKCNRIGDVGIEIKNLLSNNTSLTNLNIRMNQITTDHAVEFARTLTYNTTLRELYLGDNEIRSEGAIEIMKALETNDTLKVLDLKGNRILGTAELDRYLVNNRSIEKLDLTYNLLGSEGIIAIIKSLEYNQTLVNLKLSQNTGNIQITKGEAKKIINLLEANETLKRLAIDDLGDEANRKVIAILQRNNSICEESRFKKIKMAK